MLELLIKPFSTFFDLFRHWELTLTIQIIHSLRLWQSRRLCPCSLEGCFDPRIFHGFARWVVLGRVGKTTSTGLKKNGIRIRPNIPNQIAIVRWNGSSPCVKEILSASLCTA